MNDNYIHTFVIVAHDESPYLEDCILSLKEQTKKSLIVISTSTPSVYLNKLAEKYKLLLKINNINSGIGADWSFAYNLCGTKYVTLAHQDDIYLPNYTEYCLLEAEKHKNTIITFTDCSELYENTIVHTNFKLLSKKILLLPYLFMKVVSSSILKRSMFLFADPISCPTVMYNRHNIGKYEFSKEFKCSLDWDAWLRLSQMSGGFIYVKKKLVLHRIHEKSFAFIQTNNKIRKNEEEVILERLWPKPIAKMIANIHYSIAKSK